MSCWVDIHKICATCRYWGGKRDVEVDLASTYVETRECKGVCYGPMGSQRGELTEEVEKCGRWGAYFTEEDTLY